MKAKYSYWNNLIKLGYGFMLSDWQKSGSVTRYIKEHKRARKISKETRETFHRITKFGIEE